MAEVLTYSSWLKILTMLILSSVCCFLGVDGTECTLLFAVEDDEEEGVCGFLS